MNLLLVSEELFFHHCCQYTTVKGWLSYPPVTAINDYTNFGRTWLTMKNRDNMHNQLPLYYFVTKGKTLLPFQFVWSACCYTNILYCKACTVPAFLTAFFKSIEHLHTANCFVQIDNFDLIWFNLNLNFKRKHSFLLNKYFFCFKTKNKETCTH